MLLYYSHAGEVTQWGTPAPARWALPFCPCCVLRIESVEVRLKEDDGNLMRSAVQNLWDLMAVKRVYQAKIFIRIAL